MAYVAFSRFREAKIVFFVASDDRDWCFLLADELDAQVQRILKKKAFPYIQLRSLDYIVFLFLGGLLILWVFWIFSQPSEPMIPFEQIKSMSIEERTLETLKILSEKTSKPDYSLPIMFLTLAVVIFIIEVRPLSRLFEKASRSVFYWGDMVAIWDQFDRKMQRIKWGIFIAFIVSLFATLVGSYILAK